MYNSPTVSRIKMDTLPRNSAELGCSVTHKGDRELDAPLFRANPSSPAVRVRCGVVVRPANHGTALEFLPGFPAFQKPVAIFQL